ncbi:NAD(P)H-hydrate dehydratase [Acidiferrimicrobium sp. IK]|uniref:NAD(P)H-hydrate dehydratase n=1 Tax=Acidiferrimicrobium sp. IK TaxID=2871700 RepID=UPI0021CB7168|nr:NAD(P)H-hydrate dehydratase [Acidiferrimicrobium sp. IK]MCU4183320.1 NAD(P)H-hydrate dehydratase [Acidiferrimicrobium sp. IK]
MPDLPVPVEVTPGLLRRWPLPSHADGSSKTDRGQVLVVGGAAQTPGAVLLAAQASLRAGAGKLAVATVASTAAALAVAVPEALVQALPETEAGALSRRGASKVVDMAASATAVLLGPGMTDADECCALAAEVVERAGDGAVVLDALALAVLERDPEILAGWGGRAVLTPNRKELALMLGVDEGRVDAGAQRCVLDAARRYRAVVSLGGGESLIADPGGTLWHETSGSVGLGVSGSGDCAAGVVAGLLARGAEPAQAAVWAAHLHGSAGDRLATRVGRVGYLAREVADEVPLVLSMYD